MNRSYTAEMSLIFLHVPKAAGTTLHSILKKYYKKSHIYDIIGTDVQSSIREFVNLSRERLETIKLLKGHMPFGLHKYLPRPSCYITVLRKPIDRIISHYYYVLRTPEHYLYKTVQSRNMGLEEYVCSGITTEMDNGQVRLLAGYDNGIPFGGCSREILKQAIDNIEKYFLLVGLSERFDETLLLLRRVLIWKMFPFYSKMNVAEKPPSVNNFSKEIISRIEKQNELDCELYEFAKKQFEEKIKAEECSIKKELSLFVRLNNAYQLFSSIKHISLWK